MNRKCNAGVLLCISVVLSALQAQADVAIGTQLITTGTEIKVLGPGPDLRAIIDGIEDAFDPITGISKPYLIKLGPGYYTITSDGTTGHGLVMTPFISIMGSGQGVTVLKGAISSGSKDSSSAIVTGASNATLSNLSVENAGGGGYSIAIYNGSGAAPHIERVTATAYDSTINNGVYNFDSSSPTMTEVTAAASGGTFSAGVHNSNSSSPTMIEVTATASGGTNSNYGVYNFDSSSPTMTEVIATASGGLDSFGVYNASASPAPRIKRSFLSGGTYAMRFGGSTGTRIFDSELIGGIGIDPPGFQCRDNYDESLATVTC